MRSGREIDRELYVMHPRSCCSYLLSNFQETSHLHVSLTLPPLI